MANSRGERGDRRVGQRQPDEGRPQDTGPGAAAPFPASGSKATPMPASGTVRSACWPSRAFDKMRALGLDVGPGDFAENITTSGSRARFASHRNASSASAKGRVLEVSQIGKVCHDRCAIFEQAGDCVMPREGIFARVLVGGPVAPGDSVEVESLPEGRRKTMLEGIRFAVLTISDRSARGERVDESGPLLGVDRQGERRRGRPYRRSSRTTGRPSGPSSKRSPTPGGSMSC